MLEFSDIDISDKQWIDSLLKISDFMGCEYSFANNMAWKRLNSSKIARYKNFYISCAFSAHDGIPTFVFPAGEGDYREVFGLIRSYSESIGKPLRLWGVTKHGLALLNELFPGEFSVQFDRDCSDYIYLKDNLAGLPGKKYHKKRNHLAKLDNYNWEFSLLKENDFDDAIAFSAVNYNEKHAIDNHSSVAEQYAINTYFTYFDELGLKGGIIRIDGNVAALTIGEKLNSNTFCVHVEKADIGYNGIYVGINNEFVKHAASDFTYINREEDLGIEGLRRSKSSYYPEFILEKYTVTFR